VHKPEHSDEFRPPAMPKVPAGHTVTTPSTQNTAVPFVSAGDGHTRCSVRVVASTLPAV
jgi:hypothetical protein